MDIVRVSGSVEAGHQHVDAVAQADEKAGEQRDKDAGGAHRTCLLYTSFRSARLTLSDWLKIDQDSYANRLKLCVPVLGVGAFLGIGNALGFIDYTVIWRYFSWTNQTLAMIVLWAASMYLFKEKKNFWITAVPATFMSAVSCTYFVLAPECLGKMINTYADGKLVAYNTAVAYPIGIIFAIAMLALFIHATKKHTASQKA